MTRQQFIEEITRTAVPSIQLRGRDVTLYGFGEHFLARQRNTEILESVVPLAVDLDRFAAVRLAIGKPAQRIEAITKIIVDEIPGSGCRRLHRQSFLVKPDGRFVVAAPFRGLAHGKHAGR